MLVNPTRYPWTHLPSMSESFNQPSCPFSRSWPINTRCSSPPFRRYCIHALATSSTSLSSFYPPVLQQRGLRGSQRIRLPSSSCGRMSFHLQFAARNTSKRRYSLWEVHVPASILVSVTKRLGSSVARCCRPAQYLVSG